MAAPAAPAAGAGVEGIAGLFLVLAFLVLTALHRAWLKTLGSLMYGIANFIDVPIPKPWGGHFHPLSGAADSIRNASDAVANLLGSLALKSENGAVWCFHQAEATFRWMGAEIAALAEDTWHGIDEVITRDVPALIKIGTHKLEHAFRGIEAGVTSLAHKLEHEFKGIDALVRTLEQKLVHAVGHAATEVAHLGGVTAKQQRRLSRRVSKLEKATIGVGAAALVATALGRLGLNWIKCDAAKGLFKKRKCNLWNGLDDLLSMAIDLVVVTHICDVFPLLEEGFQYVASPLIGTLAKAGAGICDDTHTVAAKLDVPVPCAIKYGWALSTPDPLDLAALPKCPLSLP